MENGGERREIQKRRIEEGRRKETPPEVPRFYCICLRRLHFSYAPPTVLPVATSAPERDGAYMIDAALPLPHHVRLHQRRRRRRRLNSASVAPPSLNSAAEDEAAWNLHDDDDEKRNIEFDAYPAKWL